MKQMKVSTGLFAEKPIVLICDTRCDKAWGINQRPRIQLSDDEDDYCYLADDELRNAPVDPGTYEGGHGKPVTLDQAHNKWCARECERCNMVAPGELIEPKDLSRRMYNVAPHTERIRTMKFEEPPKDFDFEEFKRIAVGLIRMGNMMTPVPYAVQEAIRYEMEENRIRMLCGNQGNAERILLLIRERPNQWANIEYATNLLARGENPYHVMAWVKGNIRL